MSDAIFVDIQLFGAFRQCTDLIRVSVPRGSTQEELRAHIKQTLKEQFKDFNANLVDDSALSTDTDLLGDHVIFTDNNTLLSLLPPVCGG